MTGGRIKRPHYKSPERYVDYLETYTEKIETGGFIFTPDEVARLKAVYERLHRNLVKLNEISPEDYPYCQEEG